METGLQGRRAWVGGASKGLGLACAQALAAEGCGVALMARSREDLDRAARTLPAGVPVRRIAVDLSEKASLARALTEAEAWGLADILVLNTGGPPPGASFAHDEAAWQAAYESLLLYVKRVCEHVVPGMRGRGWGRVIAIPSRTVKEPAGELVLSNMFRAAVTAYLKVLAREVAADNVTVNTVLPGAFRTQRYEQLLAERAGREGKTVEQVEAEVVDSLPQRRFQRPEELGALVAFLASERASGINGAHIPVDGGGLLGLLS